MLVISQNFPPDVSASSILVDNIVRYYQGDCTAIGGFSFQKCDPAFFPSCKTYYLRPPNNYIVQRLYYKLMPRLRAVNRTLMRRIVCKINPDVIFGNYPEIEFFVSSFEIAVSLGIPFYAYFHDLWIENMWHACDANMAKRWEPRIFKESKRIICCTEAQQAYYWQKYGVRCDLLLHPVPDRDLENLQFHPLNGSEKRIAYVGSLSRGMNLDALVTLSKAMSLLPPHYKLYWYPLNEIPLDSLAAEGFDTSRIVMRPLSTTELKRELKQASVLVAPLSFKNCSIFEVKTVFSNKIPTYLITGRPILIYGPPDSYHARSATERGWGLVVSKDDANLLSAFILSLAEDTALQEELVQKGFQEARRRRASLFAAELGSWVKHDAA